MNRTQVPTPRNQEEQPQEPARRPPGQILKCFIGGNVMCNRCPSLHLITDILTPYFMPGNCKLVCGYPKPRHIGYYLFSVDVEMNSWFCTLPGNSEAIGHCESFLLQSAVLVQLV